MSVQRVFRVIGFVATPVVLVLALVPIGMCQTASVPQKELQLEMEGLIFEHPELLEALSEVANRKQIFESEYERKCKDRYILCRK